MEKERDRGYLYIKAKNPYINEIVGRDIKLTLKQKIEILFSKGICVVLHQQSWEEYENETNN